MRFLQTYRFTTMLFIAILVAIGLYAGLYPIAPRAVDAAVYAIMIQGEGYEKLYQIQGDKLTCADGNQRLSAVCHMTIEGKRLEATIIYTDESRHLANICLLSYDGRAIPCQPTFDYSNPAPILITTNTIGLTANRLAELRQSEPWLYWHEDFWLAVIARIAILLAIITMLVHWSPTRSENQLQGVSLYKLSQTILLPLGTFFAVQWVGNYLLMIFTPQPDIIWIGVSIISVITAILVLGWQIAQLSGWQPHHRSHRFLTIVGSGVLIFSLSHFFMLFSLLSLGFVD